MAKKKTVRWMLWQPLYIAHHKCDKLPEGTKFHEFRLENTTEQRRAFAKQGSYEISVTCPHCGETIIYEFVNLRKLAKKG